MGEDKLSAWRAVFKNFFNQQEPIYDRVDVDVRGLEKFKVRKDTPPTEEPVVEDVQEEQNVVPVEVVDLSGVHIEIDYDHQLVKLVRGDKVIKWSKIDDRLIWKSDEEILESIASQEDIPEYVRLHQPLGYYCVCHYTRARERGVRCTVCGTATNIPYYKED